MISKKNTNNGNNNSINGEPKKLTTDSPKVVDKMIL